MSSYFLVIAQFTVIAMMVLFGHGIFASLPGMLVFLGGLAFGLWALGYNRLGNFNIRPELKHGCHMVDTGPYRYIRHPMYTSVMGMMSGVVISTPIWSEGLMLVLLFIVLSAKAKREEHLWCDHHPNYATYKVKTKMFLPFIW